MKRENDHSTRSKIKVMLATEGTYPHHAGGVSTWCDSLVKNLDQVEYLVYSVIMNPYVDQKFALPDHVELIKVPLWGTDEPFEHIKIPFSQVYRSRSLTSDTVIREKFIPVFTEVVLEILSEEKKPVQLGHLLLDLYNYFRQYDYKVTFKSEITWNTFKEIVMEKASNKSFKIEPPSVFSIIQSLGWLYRFFTILTTPIPKVDITHSAAAAFCGVPCVLAKLLYNTPFLLTEHGIYIREQYLSLSKRGYEPYLNTFFIRMIKSIAKLNYAYADQVSPVCDYNQRWEIKFGVMPSKIKVIHNGVDQEHFNPDSVKIKKNSKTFNVVSIARVDPVKDLITLIRAAEIVKSQAEDIRFYVYGSVTVPQYFQECKKLVKELKLEDVFIFKGNTDQVAQAYAEGDIIALSSITEAFPYSVVEAMMMKKAIIATNVGGITEALEGNGVLVSPRKPDEMAKAILSLYHDQSLREELGEKSRQKAFEMFTIDRSIREYYESYLTLQDRTRIVNIETEKSNRQKLMAERAYALLEIGDIPQGIAMIQEAIKEDSTSPMVPELMRQISDAYLLIGEEKLANYETEKLKIIQEIMSESKSA
jgi:polysaccharide biosynthesis protein PelF